MPQHALGREHHQRFAPPPQRLPAQQMEVLRGGSGLADLNVVARGELQKALQTSAGVLRPLALVTVRKQQDEPREQSPLVFARSDELIEDHLRPVGEITKLRFPQHQGLGIIAAVTILEPDDRGFGERRIENFQRRKLWRDMGEQRVLGLCPGIKQRGMALVESPTPAVLAGHAHGSSLPQERPEG